VVIIVTKKLRIRKNVLGTTERPRLSVYRSEKHIYGQVDETSLGRTLLLASTVSSDLAKQPLEAPSARWMQPRPSAARCRAIAAGVTCPGGV
jgi:large subunit ribosomal protein L18